MATKPQIQQRWPRNAEAARVRAYQAATDARDLIDREAQDALRDMDARLLRAVLADIRSCLADIQRSLSEARMGIDPED